ncbi:alpha/beta hydrolase [Sphingobium aquiterrae]|uniref:alpha/beta fold hydrolase n=1 Tax=Sphingobium aquiterrae TaxID=2038656 RepID=UPI003019FD06
MIETTPTDPSSHIYISQRLRLHYVDWGNAGAEPVILLHGGRDHCRNWDWVARDLCRDYHVIAPDLRGHGDSQWSPDGSYSLPVHIYDLAQLIHQQDLAPVTIIAHSFGGHIALRYAGIYPETVKKLVVIEGLGLPASVAEALAAMPVDARIRDWIDAQRTLAARQPRKYASINEALERMQAENSHLSAARARHLTVHGVSQNEDGTYSWKFDNYVRSIFPVDISTEQLRQLWARIACPTLLIHGNESWAEHPVKSGMADWFPDARVIDYDRAGHWVHHDRHDDFMADVRNFLTD